MAAVKVNMIVEGRPVQEMEPDTSSNDGKAFFHIPNASTATAICVFMVGHLASFDINKAIGIYLSPMSNQMKYLGFLHPKKPSVIINFPNQYLQQHADHSGTAKLGIVVQPLNNLKTQVPDVVGNSNNNSSSSSSSSSGSGGGSGEQLKAQDVQDAALGAIFGALLGDALGGPLSRTYRSKKPSKAAIAKALKLQGGGVLRLGGGQLTDDGELVLCLATALANSSVSDYKEKIATVYYNWNLTSDPVDNDKLKVVWKDAKPEPNNFYSTLCQAASAANARRRSTTNAAIARCVPLSIWGIKLTDAHFCQLCYSDTLLTNADPAVVHATTSYCLAVRHLLRNLGDASGARDLMKTYITSNNVKQQCAQQNDYPEKWLTKMPDRSKTIPFHCKFPYYYAFQQLEYSIKNGVNFLGSMQHIMQLGGEADTNATVVGGLLGALIGVSNLPKDLLAKICSCTSRPAALQPGKAVDIVKQLLSKAPNV